MRVGNLTMNSVKERVPRLLPWLEQRRPDIVCLQETKLAVTHCSYTYCLGNGQILVMRGAQALLNLLPY